jgi:hypothetical protein
VRGSLPLRRSSTPSSTIAENPAAIVLALFERCQLVRQRRDVICLKRCQVDFLDVKASPYLDVAIGRAG